MSRIVIGFLATFFLALGLSAQDTRPASQPTRRPGKIAAAMKWSDERAKPLAIRGQSAVYGNEPRLKESTRLADIAGNPDQFAGQEVKIKGLIIAICPTKGCWLRMKDGVDELFVKFKDYAFFAPRHLKDHEVELEGVVLLKITSEDMRRHYAEEQGQTEEEIQAIKGDQKELHMEAYSMVISEPAPVVWNDENTKPLRAEARRAIFGAELALKEPTKLADLFKDIEALKGKTIQLEGLILEVCPTKGCWLKVKGPGKNIKVVFKDNLLTVPRHTRGFVITMDGTPSIENGEVIFTAHAVALRP